MISNISSKHRIIGSSEKLKVVFKLIDKIADAPLNILLTGESGTGKELAARLIHESSSRNKNPFVDINCAAIPETLLESELFGIEKGVATGVEKREGRIEQSSGGTLFLDEIGDMPLSAQVKLLRVLQEKRLRKVGGKQDISVDIRVIAATNKDLLVEIKNGNFREDLYYRLNELHIKMPSLREIREDIPLLTEHFLETIINDLGIEPVKFSDKAMEYLSSYNWPGNIRELKSEVKRSSLLAEGNKITDKDLSDNILNFFKRKEVKTVQLDGELTLDAAVKDLEIKMIIEALKTTNYNKVKSSELLGISRQGLIKKIKRYGIKDSEQSKKKISDRIEKKDLKYFVGRENELETILGIIKKKEPLFYVTYIHGIGGIGKTCLIQKIINSLKSKIIFIYLDCRLIEPTEKGFLTALSKELDLKRSIIDLKTVVNKLEKLKGRSVLVLDTYETFGLMDTWLRKTFIPTLPDDFQTLIVGRQPPNTAWLTSSGLGTFFKEIELEELSYNDSLELLNSKGITEGQSSDIYSFSRGHPLAIELASRSFRTRPVKNITYKSFPNIIHALTQEFLSELPIHLKDSLETLSIVRRFNENFLEHIFSENYKREYIDEIIELPFININSEGYIIHDIVREAISKDLSIRNPQKYTSLRKKAWSYLIQESKNNTDTLWNTTADLLYLIENPIVRDAFFPKGAVDFVVEPAINEDRDKIVKIAETTEPAQSAQIIKYWFDKNPDSFSVAKNIMGEVEAFFILCEPYEIEREIYASDPILNYWSRHLESNPIDSKDKVLFLRRWLSKEFGESPCPAQGACWLDVKRNYMELRPKLKRLYTTVVDVNTYGPIVIPLGFTLLEDSAITIGDKTYYSAMLDFGPESIDGWLKKLIGIELETIASN